MHYVIHSGGIPFDGGDIETMSLGGSESAAYYVARALATRGHRVVVFTEKEQEGQVFDDVYYLWIGNRTQTHPLGENWHFYCENTPHDVNIVQRQPGSFMFYIRSKVNLWWAHDIALKRNNPVFMAGLWQTNRVLPVSNWFKDQIQEAWLCKPEIITPIHNGVDYSNYRGEELKDNTVSSKTEVIQLLYQSRPERGLERLVREGGIMDRLKDDAPHVRLSVAGYEHAVPQLQGYYDYLRERIETLPNCEHVGALNKKDLARIQRTECDVWCYPTSFEEVSCISAMEAMAAGMYVLTTNVAALPETLGDYENQTRFNDDEDLEDKFVEFLSNFNNKFRRRPRYDYTWGRAVDEIEAIVDDCFVQAHDDDAKARHFLRNSDVEALNYLEVPAVGEEIWQEKQSLYDEWKDDPEKYAEHYAEGTERMYDSPDFEYEGEEFLNNIRFKQVAELLAARVGEEKKVIDYGCAHGHFTNYLARSFPDLDFVGVDISHKAIEVARKKADEMQLANVKYEVGDWLTDSLQTRDCDVIILGEILEHVPDPVDFMGDVAARVGEAEVIVTTPFGPWESLSYEEHHPRRFHLHHFEREDLDEMFGHHENYDVRCLSSSVTEIGELIGWYVTVFTLKNDVKVCCEIDYERKIKYTMPRQTVSLCMIVRDGEQDLLRCLRSVEPYVDEVIIGIDENTDDNTIAVIDDFREECLQRNRSPGLSVRTFKIKSPLEIGFDAARNLTIAEATKQWILWCDADEIFVSGERLPKYLRQNGWDGYGIPQHHFSTEPLGVLSTDYPVRLFRNRPNIKFEGVVHEHPVNMEKPDDGVGFAYVLNEVHFSHYGYTTEKVRRKRFMRNIKLMARDRKENPDRILGKFLWIRDCALMCRFELEQTHGFVTPEMQQRAIQGTDLWEKVIDEHSDHPQVRRMIKDHLEFYDTLVAVLNRGFVFKMKLGSGYEKEHVHLEERKELCARFMNKRHLDKFLSVVIEEEVENYDTKYE